MMNRLDIVRAWKDEEYRMSLTEAERAALPANPVGIVEVQANELGGAAGASGIHTGKLVCIQPVHTLLCPNRSYRVRACPRTVPIICQHVTLPVNCPKITLVGCPQLTAANCPRVSLACPQGDPFGQRQF